MRRPWMQCAPGVRAGCAAIDLRRDFGGPERDLTADILVAKMLLNELSTA